MPRSTATPVRRSLRTSLRAAALSLVALGALGASSAAAETSVRAVDPVIDFGTVPVGSTLYVEPRFENTGDRKLSPLSWDTTGPIEQFDGQTLDPGETERMGVHGTADEKGHHEFNLRARFTSGDDIVSAEVTLSYTGVGGLEPAADPLDFGTVDVNGEEGPNDVSYRTATFKNTLARDVTITEISTPEDFPYYALFAITERPDLPLTLAPGATLSVPLRYAPHHDGRDEALLQVTTEDQAVGAVFIGLVGRAFGPRASVTPGVIDFGSLSATEPASRTFVFENTGRVPLVPNDTIYTATGDGFPFRFTGDFSTPVQPGQQRTLGVTFLTSPTGAAIDGDGTAFLFDGRDSHKDGPYAQLDLRGTRAATPAKLEATPSSLPLGTVWVGSKLTKTITIKNDGGTTATGIAASLSGAGAASYAVSGLPPTLGPGASKTVTVTFTPKARGVAAASLVVKRAGSTTALSVPLSGRGIAPVAQYSASSLAFGTVPRGLTSKRTVTVKNTGDANLSFNAVKPTGTGAPSYAVSGSTGVLAPGASRTFTITFKPTTTGSRTAALTFSTNAIPYGPVSIPLSGAGR